MITHRASIISVAARKNVPAVYPQSPGRRGSEERDNLRPQEV
jgi:hypothetical protein